jgi:NitT/TauT family transport system substrate-binding protein
MRRLGLFLVVIVVVATMIGGYFWLTQAKPKKYTGPVEKLTIGMQNNIAPALVWIAKEKDYFEEQGLDVELRRYPSGKLALLGLFNNEVDLCTTADIPIMANSFERNDYLIFGSIANSDSALWIVARRDKGIADPEDLRGKKIATQKNSAAHFFLSMFLLHNHILESDVDISFMKAVDLPHALINGKIDAFSIRNPFIQEAKDALGDNAIEFFAPGVYSNTFNLVAKKDFVSKKPELIEGVIKAVIKAEEFASKNREQAIKTTAR